MPKTAFQIFAEYGGKQHALAERKKRHRGQADAFPEMAGNEDPTGDERYTTRETDDCCRKAARVEAWDLDVAACAEAHLADRYFTKEQNGLLQQWSAERVWCNPPYSDIEPWAVKAWAEITAKRCRLVAMLIPATRTEQGWWQREIEPYRDGRITDERPLGLRTHFLPGRTSFARPGSGGIGQAGTPFGCVLLVWDRGDWVPTTVTTKKKRKLLIMDVNEPGESA